MVVGLIALIPLLGFFYYSWQQVSRLLAESDQQEMTHYAEMAASSHSDLLTKFRTVLAVLAELPREQHFDPVLCTALFTGLRLERPEYSRLVSVDPDGEIRCSVPWGDDSENVLDREYIERAFRTGLPTTDDYRLGRDAGRASGRASIAMAHPVIGDDGEVHTVLAAGFDLGTLAHGLLATLPEGSTLTIFDRSGNIFLRLPDADRPWVEAPGLLAAAIEQGAWERLPAMRQATGTRVNGPVDSAAGGGPSSNAAPGPGQTADDPSASDPLPGHMQHGTTGGHRRYGVPVEFDDVDGVRRSFAFAPIDMDGADVQAMVAVGFDPAVSAAAMDQVLRTNQLGLALAALVLLLGIWGSFEVAVLRRLNPVIHAAEKLGAGDLDARTGIDYGRDELGELARTFDEMAVNVQGLREAEARWAEGEIREREERFAQIAARISEVFWLLEAGGEHVLYVSPAYASIWGRPMEEAYARHEVWLQTVHPDDRTRLATLSSVITEDREDEYRIVRPDNTIRWIRERSYPIANDAGELSRVVCVSEDVTDRKKLEEQLRQSHKMEAIGRLAGGVAHDFNNILTVIQGHTQLLLGEVEEDDPIANELAEIGGAAERAAMLIRQLLAFSRKQMLQLTVLMPSAVVDRMEALLRRLIGSHIALTIETEGEAGAVRADEIQVEQILLNLAVNARDAMPDGGTLTITTRVVIIDDPPDTIERMEPGEYVHLSVGDTGAGIPYDLQGLIFEPFFTTKDAGKGTGLGLATVYGIVKQSGGYIRMKSGPSQGTTFDLYFPRVDSSELPPRPAEPEQPARGGPEVILLAEDDDGVRRIARRILQREGYRVLEAIHGEDALAVAADFSGRIDLLLTDVVMPVMRGPALAALLKGERPELEVVFMSGYADDEARGGSAIPPGSMFLQKPFTSAALLGEVRRALEGPARSGPARSGASR